MVRIIADSSTLCSTTQDEEAGLAISPLSVTIAGCSHRKFDGVTVYRQSTGPRAVPAAWLRRSSMNKQNTR